MPAARGALGVLARDDAALLDHDVARPHRVRGDRADRLLDRASARISRRAPAVAAAAWRRSRRGSRRRSPPARPRRCRGRSAHGCARCRRRENPCCRQPLDAPRMRLPRAERADVEALRLQRRSERGIVDLRIVGQRDEARCSGRARAAAMPRPAIRRGPCTSGNRSGVAKAVRGSMIVMSRSRPRAMGASAWLICTAPIATTLTGGTCTRQENRRALRTRQLPLLPCRMRVGRIPRASGSDGDVALRDETLLAGGDVGDEHRRAPRGALCVEVGEEYRDSRPCSGPIEWRASRRAR